MKINVLAFGAHPDDIELSCSGTLMKMKSLGHTIGAIDLTQGELGTRGSAEIRLQEAAEAAKIMELDARENLGLSDGFFQNLPDQQMPIIQVLRKYQPDVVLCNAPVDRHPDHGKGGNIVRDAAFLSGLRRIETLDENGNLQSPWRPKKVYHYIQDKFIMPNFVVDITPYFQQKIASIKAYQTQFFDPSSKEPLTYISTQDYWDFLDARNREMGHMIGATHGEGFIVNAMMEVSDLLQDI